MKKANQLRSALGVIVYQFIIICEEFGELGYLKIKT